MTVIDTKRLRERAVQEATEYCVAAGGSGDWVGRTYNNSFINSLYAMANDSAAFGGYSNKQQCAAWNDSNI